MLIFNLESTATSSARLGRLDCRAEAVRRLAMLLTHAHIHQFGQHTLSPPRQTGFPGIEGNDGIDMWNELVMSGNFEMTYNGHFGGDNNGFQEDETMQASMCADLPRYPMGRPTAAMAGCKSSSSERRAGA